MTPQEAIDRLRKIPVRPKPNNVLDLQAIAIAINALKKQIPKKPKNLSDDGIVRYGCNCENIFYQKQSRCDKCGQALDWSDENDQL